jgi:hypothetical protein
VIQFIYIFKKGMIMSNIKGNVSSNEDMACASHDPFLKKVRSILCIWLEYAAQKGLSVSGAVEREKAMQV